MATVYKRELGSYFSTMTGYIFLGVFLFICGYGFVFGSLATGSASMFSVINSLVNVLYLLIPILTMRVFSEELRNKTDQLLFTSPVPVFKIVLGKFLSALTVILIASALSLVFPIIMFLFGSPYIREVILAYTGFLLLASSLISAGLFISTLTEHQFVACVITFFAIIMLMMTSAVTPQATNRLAIAVASWFALFTRFGYFASGILGFDAVIYYLSFTAIFLMLSTISLKRRLAGA